MIDAHVTLKRVAIGGNEPTRKPKRAREIQIEYRANSGHEPPDFRNRVPKRTRGAVLDPGGIEETRRASRSSPDINRRRSWK